MLNDNASADSGLVQAQTAISASGMFAFGVLNPAEPNVGASSGVVTLSSGNITGISDNNSSGGGPQASQAISTTYSIDGIGLGHIPSGCTPGTNCQLIFYVVSPARAVLIELQNSGGTAQTNPAINTSDQ